MSTTVLVTGPTGTIGAHVVAALAQRHAVKVRAALRDVTKAGRLPEGVTPVVFDWKERGGWKDALTGVEALFLLTPGIDNAVEVGNALVDAAQEAGVRRVVKLSAAGAEVEPGIELGRRHRANEKHIEASGLVWTHLRPNSFMENFIHYYPPREDGNIYLPLGTSATSFVAAADVGELAAAILADGTGHARQAYAVNGPDPLNTAQLAAYLGEAAGRPVQYVDVPEEAAREAMTAGGSPAWQTEAMLELFAVMKAGYAAGKDDNVQRIVRRAPIRFSQWARDHASAFRLPAA